MTFHTAVSEQPVRLAPGSPSSLQSGDCVFMRQLQEKLLAGLPVHVTVEAPIAPDRAPPHG